MKAIKLFFFCMLLAGLNSCNVEDSGDVNQDKIWTHYELFYNANDDKTIAVARFRFGSATGTLLQLNEDASVTFNGEQLPWDQWYFGHVMDFAGLVDSGTFVYQDLDQLTFTNTVMPFDTVAFPNGFDTIYKSQANTLAWSGEPLAPNEHVGVVIKHGNHNYKYFGVYSLDYL